MQEHKSSRILELMQPVQPVVVRYRYRWFDPSWVDASPSVLVLLWHLLSQVYNHVRSLSRSCALI